ncbi:gliding motility-associated C-terminal domain-containing protein [Chitinophaga defluvii]|uniref:Gliding motility-associated C-terminal domain-containing protein n=1 Tax=Chitinophaga defluvii TaxID=3163343 RepID=A0ABV2T0P9_9BACT
MKLSFMNCLIEVRAWLVYYFKCLLGNNIQRLCCVFILISHPFILTGQDIALQNPSLEGKAQTQRVPPPWYSYSKSPDTQPGSLDITLAPSDGNTFIGMIWGKAWPERFAQNIENGLKAGKVYTLSFDLAYPAHYIEDICTGSFAIYGSNPNEEPELLWESGAFYHEEWKRYSAVIAPLKTYHQLIFGPYNIVTCKSDAFTGVLVDNFSPIIREVPKIELFTRNTCKGTNTGSALVRVKGGQAPYQYTWSPGGNTTEEIANLGIGIYEVTVTGANGVIIKEQVHIEETEVLAEAVLTPATCYNLNDAAIGILVSGGNAPYSFSLNNGSVIQNEPGFKHLKAGNYKVEVMDSRGCSITLNNLHINQPPQFQIQTVNTKPVSCTETRDGKIALDVKGGTAPYSYSLGAHSWQPDSTWNQLDAGRYYFQVKDKNGCKLTGETEVVKNWRDCAVFVPTAFSPNGDGINDIFRAKVHDDVYNYRLTVYNRWGQQIFQSNDPAQGWDGGQQTTGNYFWVLIYTDSKHQARKQQGNLVLIK